MGAVSTPSLSPEEHNLRAWLLDQAERHGHAVVTVPQDEEGAPYAFSVGAWRRFGVAEAVVIGLDAGMAEVLIRAYVDRASRGERFVPGKLYHDFFQGVPVTFERVFKGFYPEFFGSAFLLYGKGDFAAVQIVVPTPQGHWPWQPDAPEGFGDWQLLLTESGRPESWTPGVDGP
ncbi:DUF4262 domain-containing protein [Saccharothrix coeruleofusca]|uniref:DUF4262 domain-containing protein n=1 Tax=Saccharothrix coeruleofusca TaxID=33919 RepID=A0A918APP1_9PSEU|nr:DUF4262 domain-containing protein [Saccharothrix coeruleofusca]GGP67161.1 hypothetical protein GCM10010185_45030 [Saccharothrix coeruleofusca]